MTPAPSSRQLVPEPVVRGATAATQAGSRGGALRSMLMVRLREPVFWHVQALVAVVTAFHLVLDQSVAGDHATDLSMSVHHIPVILYLVPVVYAGLAYGFEGGVATGVWCSLVAAPNIVVWHRAGYAWVGEASQLGLVIGMGVLLAIPVERERRQRQRAEKTARRLALLNEVGELAALSDRLDEFAEPVLDSVESLVGLGGACIGLWRASTKEPLVLLCDRRCGLAPESAFTNPRCRLHPSRAAQPDSERAVNDSGELVLEIRAGDVLGRLIALPDRDAELSDEDHELLTAVASQIGVLAENALLRAQEREGLRSYVRGVTRAQEEERTRIARDLHDEVLQVLSLLARTLDELPVDGAHAGAERVRRLAASAVAAVRRCAGNLRSPMLDSLGLVAAVKGLIADMVDRTSIEAGLEIAGDPYRLAEETEVALYRIIQESLRNVERHAGASDVGVTIRFAPTHVSISVTDDGAGFDPPGTTTDFATSGRLGLTGMRERAELVGGSLTVTSSREPGTARGSGTSVTVRVPVADVEAAAVYAS